ncbi:MAG TPA: alpha/beta hydrolase, partial [Dehalococcoidia bacterium]|nr:alpha/beta hydrolase [Dehalococcoidia bacterium]
MTTTQTYTEETTSVTGLSVRVLRGGQGPNLVWLHHSTGSIGWLPIHEKLSENFTVIVPDLPGFGQSECPVWARHPRDIALLMNRVLDKLSLGPITLVGVGLGGWIAAEMATMNQATLSNLILIGAPGIQPEEGEI